MSLEELKALARSGRLGPTDGVWQEGTTEWKVACQVPQLPFSGPPVVDYSRPPGPGQPTTLKQGFDPVKLVVPLQTSVLAIAAGYLGLFSLLGCPGPISIIVSILALRDLARRPHLDGRGRAWFGLVMGIVGTVALGFVLVLMAAGRAGTTAIGP